MKPKKTREQVPTRSAMEILDELQRCEDHSHDCRGQTLNTACSCWKSDLPALRTAIEAMKAEKDLTLSFIRYLTNEEKIFTWEFDDFRANRPPTTATPPAAPGREW